MVVGSNCPGLGVEKPGLIDSSKDKAVEKVATDSRYFRGTGGNTNRFLSINEEVVECILGMRELTRYLV